MTDKHRVHLEFDDGLYATLICPKEGCTPAVVCGFCGRSFHEDQLGEHEGCYDCRDIVRPPSECWIKGWFDNLTAEELLHGTLTAEVAIDWDGDHPVVTVVGAVAAPVSAQLAAHEDPDEA